MRRLFPLLFGLALVVQLGSHPPAAAAADAGAQSANHVDAASKAASSSVQQVGTQFDSAARASESHGISRWVWVGLAVLVVLLLVALLSRRRRRQAVIRSRIG